MPWRVAFALQAAGWWLRSDIIWSKKNPMPESCTDRPTRSHEYLFLLTKKARYFYDADAIREAGKGYGRSERFRDDKYTEGRSFNNSAHYGETRGGGRSSCDASGRNKRSVWHIATQPFPEAHFATFPEKLVEPCILAGTSPTACGGCGAPWKRVVAQGEADVKHQRACGADANGGYEGKATKDYASARAEDPSAVKARILAGMTKRHTVAWRATCGHEDNTGRCIVLDPFAGSGTVGVVCKRLGRDFVGIEVKPEYCAMARRRIAETEADSADVQTGTDGEGQALVQTGLLGGPG